MFTKKDLIDGLRHETHVILHLASKILPEHLEDRFTPPQRSLKELLQFLSVMPITHVKGILYDGDSAFANYEQRQKSVDISDFAGEFSKMMNETIALIEGAEDHLLNEQMTLFGIVTASKGVMLINFFYTQLCAYKMQLFLQIKHAGVHDITTPNLWMGMDMKRN